MAAAQTAVDMSQAAAYAAEDAIVAAKLAKVHAQAALAAAQLALELDQKVKKENETLEMSEIINDEKTIENVKNEDLKEGQQKNGYGNCGVNKDKTDSTNNTDDKYKKSCLNCKMPKSSCLNGKPVLISTDSFVGRKVKACSCGSFRTSKLLNKKATILGENSSYKINVRWDHTNDKETHYLITSGKHNFEFDCNSSKPEKNTPPKDFDITGKKTSKTSAVASYFVHRLPFRKTEKEHWDHAVNGEKHRIKFCVSENILFTGLGFLVAKTIDRVTITVLHQLEGRHDHSPIITEPAFTNVGSSKSTVVLKLKKPLRLSCDKIYLLTVNLHGGASIVGHGGEEFISVARGGDKGDVLFKFENYKKDRTDSLKGVIEKMYFDI